MKTHLRSLLLVSLSLALAMPPGGMAGTIGSYPAKTTLSGTEKIMLDDGGSDKHVTVSNLWAGHTAFSAGITASGSTAFDFSGGSGAFKTSTGLNTFGGSGHAFAASLYPAANDGAALGDAAHGFSDLFLASGAVMNIGNGNLVLTHSSGILTLGTGELRITTPGTHTASVPTLGSASTLTNKTLTAPIINGATAASGNLDFSGSSGTFKTSTGANTFGGSSHSFAAKLLPATDDGAALGDSTHHFSDLFLASGAVLNFNNGNVAVTHSSGILTMGTGELRITTPGTHTASVPTLGSTSTLTNKTLTAPVINGASAASGNFDLSGSSGTFLTSTGLNTFGGSGHRFGSKVYPTTDDGAALGDSTHHWSDLFLASGAVINFNNGNVAVTHSSGILTMGTGDLRVTNAGSNTASVVTVGGTQTLTNKTLTSPTLSSPTMTTPTLGAAVATSIEGLTSGLIFEGSTADAYETTVNATDPTADRTVTHSDASGTVMLAQSSTAVSLTSDNQAVTPGAATRLQLSSDNGTATNRTFTLSATGAITGQIYILIGPASGQCELADTGIQKLSATWSPGATDTLTLLFDGTNFIELARADN